MKFDSNQAWQQATAAVSANFSMLLPIAGVFFLVPSLVSTWFFGDMQAAMLANIANPQANEAMVQGMIGKFAGFGLAAMLVQSVGNMALLGLLTDRARPTVGEAIGNAVKSLPTVIGAIVLFIVAYFVVALVAGIVIGGAAALVKSMALTAILAIAALVAVFYVLTKLSLTLPVIVIERVMNPATALTRSWQLTKGNSFRIFLFYLLLAIAYLVVAIVVFVALGSLFGIGQMAVGAAPPGSAALIGMGLLSGVLGAVVAMYLNAILAAVHRQLSGPSADAISQTFG